MLIYLFVPLWIILCGFITLTNIKKKEIFFLILVFLFLFPLMAFRNINVGTDLQTYVYIFNSFSQYKFNSPLYGEKYSFLYSIYNIVLSYITPDYRILIFFNSLIICICFFIFLIRLCKKNILFSTLLLVLSYTFFTAFNISRQFMSIGLVFNATYYLFHRQTIKYAMLKFLIIVIIASLIHYTALFSIVMIPLFYFTKYRTKIMYSILIPITILFLFSFGGKLIVAISPEYNSYFSDNSIFSFQNYQAKGKISILYFFYLALILLYFYLRNKQKKESVLEIDLAMTPISFFYIILGIVGTFSPLLQRFNYYFSFSILMFIPAFSRLFVKNERLFINLVLCAILFIPFYIQLAGNYSGILPYSTFFNS